MFVGHIILLDIGPLSNHPLMSSPRTKCMYIGTPEREDVCWKSHIE